MASDSPYWGGSSLASANSMALSLSGRSQARPPFPTVRTFGQEHRADCRPPSSCGPRPSGCQPACACMQARPLHNSLKQSGQNASMENHDQKSRRKTLKDFARLQDVSAPGAAIANPGARAP
jgi:hypothetical protein